MSTTSGWSNADDDAPAPAPAPAPCPAPGPAPVVVGQSDANAAELSESTTRKRGRRVNGARSPGYKLEEEEGQEQEQSVQRPRTPCSAFQLPPPANNIDMNNNGIQCHQFG